MTWLRYSLEPMCTGTGVNSKIGVDDRRCPTPLQLSRISQIAAPPHSPDSSAPIEIPATGAGSYSPGFTSTYDDGSISDSRLRLPMSCSHSIQQLIQDICPLTLAYTTPLIITKTLQNEILLYIGSNALHHTRLKTSAAMQIVPVNSNSRSLL